MDDRQDPDAVVLALDLDPPILDATDLIIEEITVDDDDDEVIVLDLRMADRDLWLT